MDQAGRLSAIIGNLYDAALEPALWDAVLRDVRDFVGGVAAAIFAKDVAAKSLTIFHHDGQIDPAYTQLYFERYRPLDPASTAHFFSTVDVPMSMADIMPHGEFHQTRFYREWVRPQEYADFTTVALEKTATAVAMLGVFRSEREGVADDPAMRRMRLIAPHVRRAVLIGKVIGDKTAETATFADALDGLSAAIFLVKGDGRIVHANIAAHAMLADGDFLHAAGGRLAARSPAASRTLADILAAAESGDGAVGTKGVALPFTLPNGESHVAHVLPLTSGARRRAGCAYAAAAAIFVRKAALSMPSPPEIVARHYRLTPSELRVLLAVVEVGGVPEVADALGVSHTTVKTHLGHVYEKTGTRRQADLVKLVTGFADPLLN